MPGQPSDPVQRFYTDRAQLYDLIATRVPGVGSIRTAAIDHLDLEPGETVVEMGCGSGGNLSYLRDSVGSTGTVIGLDFSPGVLSIARDRIHHRGWDNVHAVRADATVPPLARDRAGGVDAVFSSFVSGMVDDPAVVVEQWIDLLVSGGRIGLLDAARSGDRIGRFANPLFAAAVRASSPPGVRRQSDAIDRLDDRVIAAHERLQRETVDQAFETYVGGFVRVSAGTVR